MFGDNFDLAESKLLLIYVFSKVNEPLSNLEITEIILKNNLMNYFSLQNYINDLIEAGLLKNISDDEKKKIIVTVEGLHVLSLFHMRIQTSKKEKIDAYLHNSISN